MALAWLTIALSENHLLVYCLQEGFSMPDFIKSWDPWINVLWINKTEVIEVLKAVYNSHIAKLYGEQGILTHNPIYTAYQCYLKEESRKRIE